MRDVYFEPALGHSAQRLVDGLVERTRQGRACLVEMHRFNFLQQMDQSLKTLQRGDRALSLDSLSESAVHDSARTRARHTAGEPGAPGNRGSAMRLRAWLARLHEVPRFGRATRLTGLFVPLRLLERAL